MTKNKLIRDKVVAQLGAVYPGTIYTSRRVDARDDQNGFIHVFLQSGVFTSDGVSPVADNRLIISYYSKDDSDDDLDIVATQIQSSMDEIDLDSIGCQGAYLDSFEYSDDEQFSRISLTYRIIY